jgi:chorismate mutase
MLGVMRATPDALKQIFIDLKVRKLNDVSMSIRKMKKLRANIDVLDALLELLGKRNESRKIGVVKK